MYVTKQAITFNANGGPAAVIFWSVLYIITHPIIMGPNISSNFFHNIFPIWQSLIRCSVDSGSFEHNQHLFEELTIWNCLP